VIRRRLAFVALVLLGLAGAVTAVGSAQARSAEAAIRALLAAQAAAWNRGDVEGFLDGYWKSEKLTFVTSRGVTRGWRHVLERYKRSYPDAKAMGRLSFSELEISVLSTEAAVVLGRWQLEREADRPEGHFTLVLKRLPAGWRIVHDHTTALSPPAS
jgi:uncharacterized protein (TIGR02246 family)